MQASVLLFVSKQALVNGDAKVAQVSLGLLDLSHELLVRLRHVVEGNDAPAETEEEEGAKGNEGPEGELRRGQWRQ